MAGCSALVASRSARVAEAGSSCALIHATISRLRVYSEYHHRYRIGLAGIADRSIEDRSHA